MRQRGASSRLDARPPSARAETLVDLEPARTEIPRAAGEGAAGRVPAFAESLGPMPDSASRLARLERPAAGAMSALGRPPLLDAGA